MYAYAASWAEKRKSLIESCYSVPRSSGMVLFFVTRSGQFDFELAWELVDLNTHLTTEFNIGMIEVQQIPFKEVDRFIDPEAARKIYAGNSKPHPTVEA